MHRRPARLLPSGCRFCHDRSVRAFLPILSSSCGSKLLQRPPGPRTTSAAAIWRPLARFIGVEARIGEWAARRRATAVGYEFLRFGIKQAWACLFGGAMVALLVGTYLWYPRDAFVGRYNFLFLMAVKMIGDAMQEFQEQQIFSYTPLKSGGVLVCCRNAGPSVVGAARCGPVR